MDVVSNFVLNGAAEFTPVVVVNFLMFFLVLDCITHIVCNAIGMGRGVL